MPKKDDEAVLKEFQTNLKQKLRYLGSFFSIAMIVAGLLLLANGLLGIVTSSHQNNDTGNVALTGQSTQAVTTTPPYCPAPSLTVLPGQIVEGISTVNVAALGATAAIKAQNTEAAIKQTGKWQATNYEPGDIGTGNYTVKEGDTLWEIAEAVYGKGSQWTKILKDNPGKIGFLKNGSQALIIPGEVLALNP